MKKIYLGLILGAVLSFSSAQFVFAQPAADPVPAQDSGQAASPTEAAPAPAPPDASTTSKQPSSPQTHDALDDYSSVIKEAPSRDDQIDKYQLTTIHNLSNLYWQLGMLDLKDDDAIERYLFINDCDLYMKYSHNDFEWRRIKDATRKYLAKNMALFNTHFEILLPLAVGKYDQERGEFDIEAESQLNNVKKMDVAPNLGVPICRTQMDWKNYPRNIILVLLRPLTLKSFPVSPELADLYINATAQEYSKLPAQEGFAGYQRMAFLRLKVHIIQYLETITHRTRYRAVVVGQLEGYEIYADHEKFKLLYAQDIKEDTKHRHKQHHISRSELEDATKHSGNANSNSAGTNDTTSEDNSSETDTSDGIKGTGVDPGGMGNGSYSSPDAGEVVTPGGKNPNNQSAE
jgi:hypothetical protein